MTEDRSGQPPTDGASTRAEWVQIAVPPSVRVTDSRVVFRCALGRSRTLPALVAGVGAYPAGRDRARVWTELSPRAWEWRDLPVPGGGEAEVLSAATDGTRTWVGGVTAQPGGRDVPFLVRSRDRRRWSPVELPHEAVEESFRPGALAAVENGLVAVGTVRGYRPAVLLLGDGARLLPLPVPAEWEWHHSIGIAALGPMVVAIGHGSPVGGAYRVLAYRSLDAGATWSIMQGPWRGPGSAGGVAVSAGRFVVTGGRFTEGSRLVAAAWSSADGAAWEPEELPTLDYEADEFAPHPCDDSWLEAPSVAGDRLVAPLRIGNDLRLGALERNGTGAWRPLGCTSTWAVRSADGMCAVHDDGSVLLARSGWNAGRALEVGTDGWVVPVVRAGTLHPPLLWDPFLDPTGAGESIARTPVLDVVDAAVWNITWWRTRYLLDGSGTFVEAEWDPPESEGLLQAGATGPGGARVLLGQEWVFEDEDCNSTNNVTGWFRPAPCAPWQPVGGFSTSRNEGVSDVARIGDLWVAAGRSAATATSETRDRAAVWTSVDGVRWAPANGPFEAPEDGWGSAEGVGRLPGGDPLVVGFEVSAAEDLPVAWRLVEGTWRRLALGTFGDAAGVLSSCIDDGGATLVQGHLAGRGVLLRTEDGILFSATVLGGRGDRFGPVRAVPGGFAAAGLHESDGRRGAVLWLSPDARAWHPVHLPSQRILEGVDVRVDGDHLLVSAGSFTALQVWRLKNPAALLATL